MGLQIYYVPLYLLLLVNKLVLMTPTNLPNIIVRAGPRKGLGLRLF